TAYGMNEGSGITLTDASGSGHTGTLVNGPTWVAGQATYGQALSFNGVDDAVSVANPATYNFGTADFTIEMWVKRTGLGGTQRHLFSKCTATTWALGCKELYFNPGNQLIFGSFATGNTVSSTIADTNWHHIAVTFTDSTNTLQIYVDGALATTATKNLEADGAGHVVTLGNLFGSNAFSGLLDEVRVYSRVLTLTEIQADRATPITPPTGTSLTTAYGMNEGSGITLTDASGSGHTGTLVNGPTWVAGQATYGQALSFNGVDDAVSVANPATYNFGTADFTIEMWVKRTGLGGTQRHLFSKCTATTWALGCKELYFNPGNQLIFGSFATGNTVSSTIADTNWHHIAVTFTDSTNTLQIYVDGALATTATKNLEADGAGHVVTLGNLFGSNAFSGLLDEVRVYSRVLTLTEIQADRATPITPPTGTSLTTAYGMNEGSGITLTDASGSGHTGTLVNGPTWVAGQATYGQALSFNGVDDAVSVANPATYNFGTADFTIEMWVKRTGLGGTQRHLFSKCTATTWALGCKELYFNPGNQLIFGSFATGNTVSSTIADTNWHHIAVTFTDSTNTLQIYVDGALATTATKNLEADGAGHVVTLGNLFGSNAFSGLLDEVRVYSRVLTLTEIQADRATPITPPTGTSLTTAYGMNEGSGITLTDASGSGHTGTLVNGPTWVAGQATYGQALSFNGVDDAVSVANPATYNFGTADFTIEMWVKRTGLGGTQRHLFSKCTATTWALGCKELYFNPGNQLIFGSFATGNTVSSTIADTNWHHIAVTFTDSTNTLQIYVDGALATTATKNLEADGAGHVVTLGNLLGSNAFSGVLDDVRIYSRVLTLTEIQMDRATPITPPGPDTTPPSDVTGLTATAVSPIQLNLSWTAATDNVGVAGYRVERCQGVGCITFVQIATPAGTTFGDTGLAASTTYSYRMKAVDAATNVSVNYSTVANTTTQAPPDTIPPTDPTGLTATAVSSSQIDLAWTASTDSGGSGLAGYRVERCQGTGCSTFAQIATPSTNSYSDPGLTAGTSHSYRVRAVDGAGNLSLNYSNITSATSSSTVPNLVMAYGMNEGSGTTLTDASGSGHPGTLVNGPAWV